MIHVLCLMRKNVSHARVSVAEISKLTKLTCIRFKVKYYFLQLYLIRVICKHNINLTN